MTNNTVNFISNFGCIHRYIAESNPQYTITYCNLYNKEIDSCGYDCEKCEKSPCNMLNLKAKEEKENAHNY